MFSACRAAVLLAIFASAQEPPQYVFGTTVVASSGFEGKIYKIEPGTSWIPKLSPKNLIGTIYATRLAVPPRSFASGFPGITDRFEWFAIDYRARIWIEREGRYFFRLLSDDGANLFINGKRVIDNDGIHPPAPRVSSVDLTRGRHEMQVQYFQGPRFSVALVLEYALPGNTYFEVFDTSRFLPPGDPALWTDGKIKSIKRDDDPKFR